MYLGSLVPVQIGVFIIAHISMKYRFDRCGEDTMESGDEEGGERDTENYTEELMILFCL